MKHDTAGDPLSGLKWTHRTTAKIAAELGRLGIAVCDRTVARLLKQMGFSLRVNHKKLCTVGSPDREAQFSHIAELRERFAAAQLPLISVDTKKKEMVGCFKNPGRAWAQQPVLVNDHDFRSDATGIAIPYGVYDVLANCSTVFVGTSHDTPAFAVDSIEKWWRTEGWRRYRGADQLAILADSGGSNGARTRAWKIGLQQRLCTRFNPSFSLISLKGFSGWKAASNSAGSGSKNEGGRLAVPRARPTGRFLVRPAGRGRISAIGTLRLHKTIVSPLASRGR